MADNKTTVVDAARDYYNSDDADHFYFNVWGGEDLHIGIYENTDSILEASRQTVYRIASKLDHWPAGTHELDIGAGYGGSGRYLAREKGFKITCLNISEVQNERNRRFCQEQGLDDKIDVYDGDFENLPFEDNSFDLVWCQDSILHSGNRFRVFQEVDRVLKSKGEFIFTDPMQRKGVPQEDLQPVLDRIHLETMGSIEDYKKFAEKLDWEVLEIEEMAHCLSDHYSNVKKNLESREEELSKLISREYRERMLQGLQHWVDAANKGAITWGILHFKKKS